jgi:hypothetical protein
MAAEALRKAQEEELKKQKEAARAEAEEKRKEQEAARIASLGIDAQIAEYEDLLTTELSNADEFRVNKLLENLRRQKAIADKEKRRAEEAAAAA